MFDKKLRQGQGAVAKASLNSPAWKPDLGKGRRVFYQKIDSVMYFFGFFLKSSTSVSASSKNLFMLL